MGYVFVTTNCVACGVIVCCNPNTVPSLRINGKRRALCKDCAERWNRMHPENAREIPRDAYEAADENEVNWGGA